MAGATSGPADPLSAGTGGDATTADADPLSAEELETFTAEEQRLQEQIFLEKVMQQNDTTITAVKCNLGGRKKNVPWKIMHENLMHVGQGKYRNHQCDVCALTEKKNHRTTNKVDPHYPLQIGWWFAADILTVNVKSRHNFRYVMLIRDIVTGWFAPPLFLELRSDVTSAFKQMITEVRSNPRYMRLGHTVIQELRTDGAGEFTGAEFQNMMTDMKINHVVADAQDKRWMAHGEAAVKHIEVMLRAALIGTKLSPIFWPEVVELAVFIRNRVPINRNIVAKDGDTARPEEQVTKGYVSRAACDHDIGKVIPPGTPCVIYMGALGSDLLSTKGVWAISMGIRDDKNLFYNPYNGRMQTNGSWASFKLPQGMDAWQFMRLPSPRARVIANAARDDPEAHRKDIVVLIDKLSEIAGEPAQRDDVITRARGAPVPGMYVLDKDTGEEFMVEQRNGRIVADITNVEPMIPVPIDITDGSRYKQLKGIFEAPASLLGRRFWKQWFAAEDGKHVGDFEGLVIATYMKPDYGQRWKVKYFKDGDIEEFGIEQVDHHIVQGWVSILGWAEPYKRNPESHRLAELATKLPPSRHIHGMVNPYASVPRGELNIAEKRDVIFTVQTLAQAYADTWLCPHDMSLPKALRTAFGLGDDKHDLYEGWAGKNFSPTAVIEEGVLGLSIPRKWEGDRTKMTAKEKRFVKKGTVLPTPMGESWMQWLAEHDRQQRMARAPDVDESQRLAMAHGATMARMHSCFVHDRVDNNDYITVIDDNRPDERDTGAPAKAMSISAVEFKRYMGDRCTDAQLKKRTCPTTGKLLMPSSLSSAMKEPDAQEWSAAEDKEMKEILERPVFSEPMTLGKIRSYGVMNKPIKCSPVLDVKSLPTGAYDKHKVRYCINAHPGVIFKYENYTETFSASPNAATERLLMWLVAQFDLDMDAWDLVCAYLNGMLKPEEFVVVRLDPKHRTFDPVTGEELFRILFSGLYGHPASGLRWSERRTEFLLGPTFNNKEWRCRTATYDAALYVLEHDVWADTAAAAKMRDERRAGTWTFHMPVVADKKEFPSGSKTMITRRSWMSIHTDDCSMISSDDADRDYVKKALHAEFGIKQVDPSHMLGLVRTKVDGGRAVTITMASYIEGVYGIFEKYMSFKKLPKSPSPPGTFLSRGDIDENLSAEDVKTLAIAKELFGKLVGCCLWITRCAKPEIALEVHMLCKMMQGATLEAWKCGLHLVAYCYGTREKGVKMSRTDGTPRVVTWYDASNKADEASRGRAIGGHIVFIGQSPVEWRSSMNTFAGQSSQHNEYQALTAACKATVWVRHVLTDMGFQRFVNMPSPILGDNTAAIALARNEILTLGNRFYTKDLHYAKEVYKGGICCPRKVDTKDNISDGMTKSLPVSTFLLHVDMMTGYAELPPIPEKPRS